ncbi:MAG TPA: outer membrane lipoprotein chaperone LolA, partial [Steroidobacteraceae bacterium]
MKSVTRAILIGFSALLVASLARSANEAAHSTEAGAWLQGYLSGFASFQADFHQRSSNAAGDRTLESAGTLYPQKPGRFRWDYREPTQQLIVSDGAKIWLYDVDLEQVTVKTVDDSLT